MSVLAHGLRAAIVGNSTKNYEADFGTPDYTITSFPSTENGTSNSQDVLIAIDVTIGSSNGLFMELGGTGSGLAIGTYNDKIRFRCYSAGTAWTSIADSVTAYFEIDISSYVDTFCTYYFTVDNSIRTAKAYVQVGGKGSVNQLIELATNAAVSAGSTVYGSAGKGYGTVNTSVPDLDAAGDYEANFTGTIDEIRYWAEDAALDVSTFGAL